VLGALRKHHLDFVISIIDSIIESITFGLEINEFKFNQRRVAEVRYIGELYCEKVVDSRLIFDTLFKIITYGHGGGVPKPSSLNPLDLSDDYFRIRLACTLLDVLGELVEVFDRGPAKKKLDFFLTFFQYYIATKDPLPMDTDFLVQDTFYKLRPQWKLLTELEDAGKAFADVVQQNYQNTGGDRAEEEVEEDSASDDENEQTSLRKEEADKSSGEEIDDIANGEETPEVATEDEDDEEHIIVTRPEDERDPEADADFDRELAKMMAESVESRKFERKPMFDVPLPMRRKADSSLPDGVEPTNGSPQPLSTMKFSLLSKKGNRQQVRLCPSYFDISSLT
jgi:regulator of nonsense transcripts 2